MYPFNKYFVLPVPGVVVVGRDSGMKKTDHSSAQNSGSSRGTDTKQMNNKFTIEDSGQC